MSDTAGAGYDGRPTVPATVYVHNPLLAVTPALLTAARRAARDEAHCLQLGLSDGEINALADAAVRAAVSASIRSAGRAKDPGDPT